MRTVAFALTLFAIGCNPLRVDAATSPVAPGDTVTVDGAGFVEGLTFSLEGPGVDVTLQDLEVGDGTTASATVPEATPIGTYDLVATIGSASATLEDGVRVVVGGLAVHFVDVGQGDATLVVAAGGETLLIDGGPRDAGGTVRSAIRNLAGD